MVAVRGVDKWFGGIHAVRDVTLDIAGGTITGLIGPNGAGKTTLFNIIAGHYKPTSGTISLAGEDVTGLDPHDLFGRGLLRTFQLAQEFDSLPVRENLMMVPPGQPGENLLNAWFPSRPRRRARARAAPQGRRGARLPDAVAPRGRARRQPLRRPEEAPRARPHHDGRRQDRLPRRGRGRGEPHPPPHHRRRHPDACTPSAATRSASSSTTWTSSRSLCDPVIVMAEGTVLARRHARCGDGRRGASSRPTSAPARATPRPSRPEARA